MLHCYVTDMAARVTPTIQIPKILKSKDKGGTTAPRLGGGGETILSLFFPCTVHRHNV